MRLRNVGQFDPVAAMARGLLCQPIPHALPKETIPMKKHSIGTLAVLTATVLLSGCALYFGDEHDRGGGNSVSPGGGSGSGSAEPGQFECQDNGDCAAGCYCSAGGICEEAGFCTQDSDCGEGYECNETRSSCEPVSCVCSTDAEAAAQGYDYCDEATITCKKGTDPAGTCAGVPTCNILPPTCAPGDVPLLGADGCWNGQCEAATQCAAPPECSHINDEANCTARPDCAASVNGINCTKPDGSACQSGDSNCSCEQLVFAACRAGN